MKIYFYTSHTTQSMIKDKWLCPVGDEKHSQWHTDDEVGVYQVSHTGIFLEGTHGSLWRRRHGLLFFLLLHSTDPEQSRFEFRGTRFTGHRPTGVWGETRRSELHVNRFKLNISEVHEYTWWIKCILYCLPDAFRHLHCLIKWFNAICLQMPLLWFLCNAMTFKY